MCIASQVGGGADGLSFNAGTTCARAGLAVAAGLNIAADLAFGAHQIDYLLPGGEGFAQLAQKYQLRSSN